MALLAMDVLKTNQPTKKGTKIMKVLIVDGKIDRLSDHDIMSELMDMVAEYSGSTSIYVAPDWQQQHDLYHEFSRLVNSEISRQKGWIEPSVCHAYDYSVLPFRNGSDVYFCDPEKLDRVHRHVYNCKLLVIDCRNLDPMARKSFIENVESEIAKACDYLGLMLVKCSSCGCVGIVSSALAKRCPCDKYECNRCHELMRLTSD